MTLVLTAMLPALALIGLGQWMRRAGFLAEAFWPQAERLAYWVLLPALFAHALATARLDGVPVQAFALVLLAGLAIVALALLAGRPALGTDGPAFTSVFQGGIRFNNYIGLTVLAGLLGAEGVALAAMACAVIVPTVNVLCVLVFARYGAGTAGTGWRACLRTLATNPLILSCALGGALNATGIGMPDLAAAVLRPLGQAALPLGLLIVGAALDPQALHGRLRLAAAASGAKFLLLPATTVAACLAVGLDGPAAVAAVMMQAQPTATSSYVLSRQLGGDAPLMAAIIAIQTPLAAASLPLALAAVHAAGLW